MATEPFDIQQTTRELRALTGTITKTAGKAMHERLAKSGVTMTPVQFGALRVLSLHPHTLSELSKIFVLDPSTLVPVVDGLEARGLVERRKDPKDRRRVPLVVTDAGERALMSVMEIDGDDVLLSAVESLGPERALQLRDLLRALLRALPEGEDALCSMEGHLKRIKSVQAATTENPPT